MAIKPISFSTPMVQAERAGKKTQTRRTQGLEKINEDPDRYLIRKGADDFFVDDLETLEDFDIKPKFNSGDILWVRETWFPTRYDYLDMLRRGIKHFIKFKADNDYDPKKDCVGRSWKPSIHMPKIVCREFLEVTGVRAERLQDISSKDAKAEGAKDHLKHHEMEMLKDLDWIIPSPFNEFQFGFLSIWCSINGCKSWEANPWVWVYEFRRTNKPENFLK
jgi:hypothetical protein